MRLYDELVILRRERRIFSLAHERVQRAVRSADYGFVLQNVELCQLKRVVPGMSCRRLTGMRDGHRCVTAAPGISCGVIRRLAVDAGFRSSHFGGSG